MWRLFTLKIYKLNEVHESGSEEGSEVDDGLDCVEEKSFGFSISFGSRRGEWPRRPASHLYAIP